MSEHGFNFEGFLRTLQPDIGGVLGSMLFMLIFWVIVSMVINRTRDDNPEAKSHQRILNWGVAAVVIAILVLTIYGALGRMAANRIPRSDVDKSAVYERMESHRDSSVR